jgi:hypothetical protein
MTNIISKAQNLSVPASLAPIVFPYGSGTEKAQVDRFTLVLHLFELLISQTFQNKLTRDDVVQEVEKLLIEQYQALDIVQSKEKLWHEADKITTFLLGGQIAKYKFFDRDSKMFRSGTPFSFLVEEEDVDEVFYIHLTNESINLFLNALEMTIEEKQVGYQAILEYQIAQGKFADTQRILEEHINTSNAHFNHIMNLKRELRHNAGTIRFDTIKDILKQTRKDVATFLRADRNIQEQLRNINDTDAPDDETYNHIQNLIQGIKKCITIYSQLDNVIRLILEEFIEKKSLQISLTGTRAFYDLERHIQKPILDFGISQAIAAANPMFDALIPAKPAKVADPAVVIYALMQDVDKIVERPDFRQKYKENREKVKNIESESPKQKHLEQARQYLQMQHDVSLSQVVRKAQQDLPMDVVRCIPYVAHNDWGMDLSDMHCLDSQGEIPGLFSFTDIMIRPKARQSSSQDFEAENTAQAEEETV